MLKEYASPLTLELKPSFVLNSYLAIFHLLAVFSIVYADLYWWLQIPMIVFIIVFYFYQASHKKTYKKIVWYTDNDWQLIDDHNNEVSVYLTPMSFCSMRLVILALKTEEGKRINITVAADSLNEEIFRQLKVRLRILKLDSLLRTNSVSPDDF